jgi:MFS family permease
MDTSRGAPFQELRWTLALGPSTIASVPPASSPSAVKLLLAARGVRAVADGFVSLLLPVHLLRSGYGPIEVGLISTITMLGSAALTLTIGLWASRFPLRRVLLAMSALMVVTGLAVAVSPPLWVLLVVAFVGTLNPSVGDVSAFRPLEQSHLAGLVAADRRTTVYARYSLIGMLGAAAGTQAAALPEWLGLATGPLFAVYAALGAVASLLYAQLPAADAAKPEAPRAPLGPRARRPIFTLAALFSIDSLGGGFVLQSMLATWLLGTFALSEAHTSMLLTAMQLLSAASLLLAPAVARRIGLVNTMVFTHLPSNIFLMLAPFAPTVELTILLLLLRSALSSMDVPPRTALVMGLVEPHERAAAASITDVPRSLAAALAPTLAGWLLAASPFGWFAVVGGGLKLGYDLALLHVGRRLARERGLRDFT